MHLQEATDVENYRQLFAKIAEIFLSSKIRQQRSPFPSNAKPWLHE